MNRLLFILGLIILSMFSVNSHAFERSKYVYVINETEFCYDWSNRFDILNETQKQCLQSFKQYKYLKFYREPK